jgi:hypothetical protein
MVGGKCVLVSGYAGKYRGGLNLYKTRLFSLILYARRRLSEQGHEIDDQD